MHKLDKVQIASSLLNVSIADIDGVLYKWNANPENCTELTSEELNSVESAYANHIMQWEQLTYQRDRATAYPNIADQLDMLYHDIKAGTLDTGAWIQAIEAVKTEYPKP